MKDRGKLGDPKFLKHYQETLEDIKNLKHIEILKKKIKIDKVLTEQDYISNKFNVIDSGTTHINVIDSNDLITTITSTVNLEFGAKIMDPVTGIILNNQMDDFYYPDNINILQEVSNVPNLARAKQIPLSSAAPVILENNDEAIILGAAGGIRIPTSIIEVIFWLTLGFNLDDAINKPRFHHQSSPNVVYVESSEKASVINYLKNLGHVLEVSITNTVFTSVQGIIVKGFSNKIIHAVSDVRKGGKSAGD
ncbi:gamma glutamyl transpeptidase [Vairimorpha apis BRL 01]|uniref:Gamma glutamyl transpeptidase n=1 Tax=Vairimorpha apis BRL 01 TaxID=1037528 RepID=T0L9J3_9MICR|nr:gamma glutamyl transpeptidase [Vairimorpha apis BRL 01]